MARRARPSTGKTVETLRHGEATRKNIPTAEYQPVLEQETQNPIRVAYEHRNRDLDPQLVWRGKDVQNWSDLVVQAPPLYIQEKIHPKALVDDLLRQTGRRGTNRARRMILGDSLHVMASLAEREGLRGKVQCIYIDPPYGTECEVAEDARPAAVPSRYALATMRLTVNAVDTREGIR